MMNAVLTFDSARVRQTADPGLNRGAAGGNRIIPFRPASRPAAPPPSRTETPSPVVQEPAPQPVRLARLIRMASVGGYMAVRNDTLVELGGRMIWPTAEALIRDAEAAGIPVSTLVIDTSHV